MWGYGEGFVGCGSLERLALVFGLKSGIAQAQLWGIQRVGCCTND